MKPVHPKRTRKGSVRGLIGNGDTLKMPRKTTRTTTKGGGREGTFPDEETVNEIWQLHVIL